MYLLNISVTECLEVQTGFEPVVLLFCRQLHWAALPLHHELGHPLFRLDWGEGLMFVYLTGVVPKNSWGLSSPDARSTRRPERSLVNSSYIFYTPDLTGL